MEKRTFSTLTIVRFRRTNLGMTPAERIIGKFESARELARRLGHANHTTVQGWRVRGLIPIRHAAAIMAVSTDLKDPVVPTDFLPSFECAASPKPEIAA